MNVSTLAGEATRRLSIPRLRTSGQASLWALAAALISSAGSAQAQTPASTVDAPPAANPTPSTTDVAPIGDIIVTARRRAEASQSVPAVVASVSGASIQNRAITNISEVQYLVPTLRVTTSTAGRQDVNFTLRGLRSNGVVVYFSQVPARGAVVGRELYDISSVQVLKGPQGTLFGRNTTAGAVLIEPARPTGKTEGSAELSAGNYNYFEGQATLNLPVSDTLMLRVAGQAVRRGGITKNLSNGANARDPNSIDSSSGRASLLFKPSSSFENLLTVDRFYADENVAEPKLIKAAPCPASPTPAQSAIFAACKFVPPFTTSLGLPSFTDAAATELMIGPRKAVLSNTGRSRTSSWGVTNLTTASITDTVVFKNIFGYRSDAISRAFDGDGTNLPVFYSDAIYKYRQYSDESQIQADISALKVIAGTFFSRNTLRNNETFSLGATPIKRNGDTIRNSKALFTQATLAATDRLNLTAGFRYTWEDQRYQQTDFTGVGCTYKSTDVFARYVDFTTCNFDQKVKFHEPSWTFSGDYKLSRRVLAYVTARRGFNSGGINISPPIPFGTERIDDVEAGLKSDFTIAGAPVRANFAAFQSKYRDLQRQNTTFLNGRPTVVIQNAARATTRGLELEAFTKLHRLDVSGSVTYLDAKYHSFVTDISPTVSVDISSNALAQAPKYTAVVTGGYHLIEGSPLVSDLLISATWSYQSKIFFEDFNTASSALPNTADPINKQKAYGLWNAQLVASDLFKKGFEARLFVKNLTNKLYAVNQSSALSSFGYATAIWGEPRTWGAAISVHF